MTATQFFLLILYAVGLAVGQTLFKLSSGSFVVVTGDSPVGNWRRILSVATDPYFVTAIAVYVTITLLWVWILSFTPLSRAILFSALAIVIAVVIGVVFFREEFTRWQLIGTIFIIFGLMIASR